MNQIPNIEETYNTREVEEMIAFVEVDGVGVALFQSDSGLKLTVSGSKEFIKEIPLHHQLQKNRASIHTSLVAAVEDIKDHSKRCSAGSYRDGMLSVCDQVLNIINSIFKE